MKTFTTRRKVEFADTDMGGIVHFSRFFVFMETAEHEFLLSLGSSVHFSRGEKQFGWPRVDATCTYNSPARYGDELQIELSIAHQGSRSMAYEFVFSVDDRKIASGRLSAVCCQLNHPDGLKAVSIPAELAASFGKHAKNTEP
jgi:YbgC/YbaW family acyl-CoA thioester hydrolase